MYLQKPTDISYSEKEAVSIQGSLGGDFAQNVISEEDIIIDEDTRVEEKGIESEEDILEEIVEEEKPQESKTKEEKIDGDNVWEEKDTSELAPQTVKEETVDSKKSGKQKNIQDTVSKEAVKEIEDMDIILEEDDELIISDDKEELLITEEPKKDTSAAPEVLKSKEDTAGVTPDSLKQATTPAVEGEEVVGEPEMEPKKEKEAAGEEKVAVGKKSKKKKASVIEDASSINFSKNLKEYRSPKKAMFMSLLVPGLGQAYTKKYWKTAVLGVLEAALIGFSVKNSLDGRNQLEAARDYADIHFIPLNFFTFYENFMKFFKPDTIDFALIFYDTLDNYISKYTGITQQSHDKKTRKDFDKDIQSDVFVQGWDDCHPFSDASGYDTSDNSEYFYNYNVYNKDTSWILNMYNKNDTIPIATKIYGYSPNQQRYNHMISLSNHYYNVSRNLAFFIIANHLISAVDAFISARSYNDMLLNKKSVWQRIDLDHQVAFTDNGFESRLDVKVRF